MHAIDRILATCEENKLEYVTDPTNFQPEVTLRNAIRHEILNNAKRKSKISQGLLPPAIAERLDAIEKFGKSLKDVTLSLTSSMEELRSTVCHLNSKMYDIDDQVDRILKRAVVSIPDIPPGNLLLSNNALSEVTDAQLRRALVLRILRYASYHPWGSVRATANQRKDNVSQIIGILWNLPTAISTKSFSGGGGVVWKQIFMHNKSSKTPIPNINRIGWLVSRQPPLARHKLIERGIPNTLEVEITQNILAGVRRIELGGPFVQKVLYDNRYQVEFDLTKIPKKLVLCLEQAPQGVCLMLLPRAVWNSPVVALARRGAPESTEVLHDMITEKAPNPFIGEATKKWEYRRKFPEPVESEWVRMEWIRPLTAL
ncbi:hypothetical protein H0H81_007161 [Sphagnurus paluster]|uniref:Uncharacterized protein n=1 Tax=Sphagnurus paluster TaxID=117069 RepID=A0A9P7GQF6_9AGAR|nr:hypothetical protein H0H81_007161 [Sphagnurus paluster]